MDALIYLGQWIWGGIAAFFTWVKNTIPMMFNKVWAAGLLVAALAYSMITKASSLLGSIADKLDSWVFTPIQGHAPSGGGAATGGTIRFWLELGNALFPINEGFVYLVSYLSLLATLFLIGLLWKLVSKVW